MRDYPGKTPIVPYEAGKEMGFDWVGIKDESINPTGTFKDRRSVEIIEDAEQNDVDKLVLISAGNAAYSLAHFAKGKHLEIVPILSDKTPGNLVEAIEKICPSVVTTDLDSRVLSSDDLKDIARIPSDRVIWDVSNGYERAYGSIVREIHEPDAIVVPCGSGEAMVGIHDAVQERGWDTKVLGVTSLFLDKLRTTYTPYQERLEEIAEQGHTTDSLHPTQEIELAYQDTPVKAEPAAKLVCGMLERIQGKYKRVLLINSGSGAILDQLPGYNAWPSLQEYESPKDFLVAYYRECERLQRDIDEQNTGCYPW